MISPLGGVTFQIDERRIFAALSSALEHAGSSYVEMYKATMEARKVIEKLRAQYYPVAQIEKQVKKIEDKIDKATFKGGHVGKTFTAVAGDHRKGHLKLDELGRGWTEAKKVEHLLGCIHVKGSEKLNHAILNVEDDGFPRCYCVPFTIQGLGL